MRLCCANRDKLALSFDELIDVELIDTADKAALALLGEFADHDDPAALGSELSRECSAWCEIDPGPLAS